MGCCQSEVDEAAKSVNEQINRELKKQKKMLDNELRLLLLGAGESGKSTIVKQMRIIHNHGYSQAEKMQMVPSIYANLLNSIKAIAKAMVVMGIPLASGPSATAAFEYVMGAQEEHDFEYNDVFFDNVKLLWQDEGVRACFKRSNEYQLIDSAEYFFESIDTLRKSDYVPSDQDILRLRVVTSGIFEIKFSVNDVVFHMFDVGGQRSERRKWIQCFGDVTGIIFVVATSGYDMVLREDSTQNRLQESLELFGSIWKNRWLETVSVVLFLNKIDLLEKKLRTSDMGKYFSDYTGGNDLEAAKMFIEHRFFQIGKPTEYKRVYAHFTVATDTENVKRVFEAVKDIILHIHLREYGLL
eukprot:Nk52_evm15s246 gene=Nk52_evmTU15s246